MSKSFEEFRDEWAHQYREGNRFKYSSPEPDAESSWYASLAAHEQESAAAMEEHDAEVIKNFISEFGIGLHMVCPDELKRHDAELREKVIEEIAAKINFLSRALKESRT
jgi:hypothetical protein